MYNQIPNCLARQDLMICCYSLSCLLNNPHMVCISVYYIGKMCNLVIAGFLRRVIIGQSRMTRNSIFSNHTILITPGNIRKSQEVLKDIIALT